MSAPIQTGPSYLLPYRVQNGISSGLNAVKDLYTKDLGSTAFGKGTAAAATAITSIAAKDVAKVVVKKTLTSVAGISSGPAAPAVAAAAWSSEISAFGKGFASAASNTQKAAAKMVDTAKTVASWFGIGK